MKRIKTIFHIILVLLLMSSLMLPTQAADASPCGLIMKCEYEQTSISGMPFSLYYVGSISGATIQIRDEFASFPLDLRELDDDGWNQLALAMKGYVLSSELQPTYTGQSDENGVLKFENITAGLYYVLGARTTVDAFSYTSVPFFVTLPYFDAETSTYYNRATVHPKFTAEPYVPTETVTRKVLKIWNDDEYENERPNTITMRLYCDGVEYEAVSLNAANNWRHTWEELPADHDWVVVEDPMQAYTVYVEQEGVTFTVTNTYVPSLPPKPPDPPKPPPGGDDLPHTGLYWWPVMTFSVLGLLFVCFGVLGRKGIYNAEKTE